MRYIIITLSLLISISLQASDSLFSKANEMYGNENYTQAILTYEKILSNNLESAELYYNLGNCYYKIEDWANAIWYYEKSLKIKKSKKTIENLSITESKIIDRIEPMPEIFYNVWWYKIIKLFTSKTWQILSLLCIWTYLIVFLLNTFTIYKIKKLTILLFISFLLFAISQSSIIYNSKQEAIIFSSAVQVTSAPTNNSVNLFSLHAGIKVEIIDEIGDWVEIKIINGQNGWIKKDNCKLL